MYLETEGVSPDCPNVTEAQLRETFRKGHGPFIILNQRDKRGDDYFIQACGDEDDLYDRLEYREGDNDHHFRATGKYTKAQVEQAFLYYLNNDNRWRTEYPWEKLVIKPWWKFW